MSTRQVPVLNARGLSRTSSASTVTPVSHRSGTVSPLVELTSDEGVEGTAKDVGKDDRMAISTVMIQDFMAIDVDVSSGDDFDKNFDMNISTDLKESALPTASHANSIVPVQLQPSFGQGRPSTQRPPQLGMRRPALLSANPHHSTAYPMSSQYSTPSQVRKGTVPRFKPPLLNTATAASRARVERSSTSIASTDPQTDSGIRGAHKAIPQRQNGTSSAPLKADPDSSFDISLELDVDVLEEAMRPYDQKTW
ncbi:hypothetical protein ID866_3381 [Astraeus odoratus]|nr:hypothetical protein ID866_3381 [Astraeus odoratus]